MTVEQAVAYAKGYRSIIAHAVMGAMTNAVQIGHFGAAQDLPNIDASLGPFCVVAESS